jgi:threonine/homoserine/homoserine lactone efflux protein
VTLGAAVLSFAIVAGVLTAAARAGGTGSRADAEPTGVPATSVWRAARTGLVTNLLNPKVGVFYIALHPLFLPVGSDPLAVGLLLAGVHGALSAGWFALLIALSGALSRRLRRPATVRGIDGLTGVTLVGSGVRLAFAGR